MERTASHFQLELEETKEQLGKAREILLEERRKRPPPHLDDKMVTAWNGEGVVQTLQQFCFDVKFIYIS